jgi:tetratricopeptide (TPR) repeat protein
MFGTPAYMAPEQIEEGRVSIASDLYAFGVLLYEMATGALPHESSSPMALAVKKVRHAPPAPSLRGVAGLPPWWDAVLLRALAVQPEARFASATEMVEALEGDRSTVAPAPPPPIAAPRRRLWGLLAIAAAATLLLAIWQPWRGPSAYRPQREALEWFTKGETALAEDAPYKASRLLERTVRADPGWPVAHARLAQAYWEADRIEDAREQMLRVSTLVPDRSRLSNRERLLIEGVQLLLVRDFDNAAARFGELPDTAGQVDRGKALALANHTKEAVALFEQLTKQAPRDAAVWLHLAIRQAQQQNLTPALNAFEKAEELFRLDSNLEGVTSVILRRSRALQMTKRLAESRAEVEKALELAATTGAVHQQAQALSQLAALASLAGQTAEARTLAARVLHLASTERMPALAVAALNGVGMAFLAQLDYEEAEGWFRRALELAERSGLSLGDATARLNLAQTLVRQNRPAEGLQLAHTAREFFEAGNYRDSLVSTYGLIADAAKSICGRPNWRTCRWIFREPASGWAT